MADFDDDAPDAVSFDDALYAQNVPLVTPKVTGEQKNMRLDKFLAAAFPRFSRNQMIRMIAAGAVVCDGDPARALSPDGKVKAGDSFTITPPDATPAGPEPEDIPLDILYEDSDLLVVNKPAGLVVHPGAGNPRGTLVNALLAHCKDSLSGIGGVKRPGIVHRIDKDTSGILVAAKNDFAHTRLARQFAEHTIERIYQAFVWGYVRNTTGLVVGNIGRSPADRQKMAIVRSGGKSATTHYERLAVFGAGVASRIQCMLETGRTHQIRVHMASIGHSLVGDPVYGVVPKGAPDFAKYFPRQALHAGYLGFIHPRTGEKVAFSAPLPDDMRELLDRLEDL
ncbi:MAG: RluA family pseudouridine synthase [Alphaproteobacteria bacterium]|nr:RluA family pseudouridine synthase [Alphaproteobacteria bacterium]